MTASTFSGLSPFNIQPPPTHHQASYSPPSGVPSLFPSTRYAAWALIGWAGTARRRACVWLAGRREAGGGGVEGRREREEGDAALRMWTVTSWRLASCKLMISATGIELWQHQNNGKSKRNGLLPVDDNKILRILECCFFFFFLGGPGIAKIYSFQPASFMWCEYFLR